MSNHSVQNEDEDLFDFPVMEMTSEGVGEAKPEDDVPLLPDVERLVDQLHADAPAPALPSSPPLSRAKTPSAPVPAAVARAEVASAAQLVSDLQHVAPALVAHAPQASATAAIPARWKHLATAALVLVLVVNGTAAWLLYRTQESFGAGLDGLRDDMALTTRQLQLDAAALRSRENGAVTGSDPVAHPAVDPAASSAAQPPHSPEPEVKSRSPLESYEESALVLAGHEIDAGNFASARRRLYRLLAIANRIEPALRVDLEARASFLVARSYDKQAALTAEAAQ